MAGHRLHERLDCEDFCYLKVVNSIHSGIIKNISLGGALVHIFCALKVGDNCAMSVSRGLFCDFKCEVVRVESPNVALKFIDIGTSSAFVQ